MMNQTIHVMGPGNLGKPNITKVLKTYFQIFDDVFFSGLLDGACKLKFLSDKTHARFGGAADRMDTTASSEALIRPEILDIYPCA